MYNLLLLQVADRASLLSSQSDWVKRKQVVWQLVSLQLKLEDLNKLEIQQGLLSDDGVYRNVN